MGAGNVTLCGDGRIDVDEICDDGNLQVGDFCAPACLVEPDADADGHPENPGVLDPTGLYDNCVDTACVDEDMDRDGVFDRIDNCPEVENPAQLDRDGDGSGDACDDDRDGDSLLNSSDLCPDVEDETRIGSQVGVFQDDLDGDGIGDLCDDDRDGDGIVDCAESGCPTDLDG